MGLWRPIGKSVNRRVGLALFGIVFTGVLAFYCTTLVVAANAANVSAVLQSQSWVLCYNADENTSLEAFDRRYGQVVDLHVRVHTLIDVTSPDFAVPSRDGTPPRWLMCTQTTDINWPR